MEIDIRTLILILGVTHLMQVLVFSHQYKINKTYAGIGWWLLWSATEAIGFSAILFRNIPAILPMVIIIQNSMIVAGTVFMYIGVMRFFNKPVNLKMLILLLSVFFISLLYFLFIENNIQIRTIVICSALAAISFITAHGFYFYKPKYISIVANFNAFIFLIHGVIMVYRWAMIIISNPSDHFFEPTLFNVLSYFDALIVSLLGTFGIIIMLNQRLNVEMLQAKNELQLIFNTSPDAAVITQLDNGLIVDINEGFTAISGFSRKDTVGKISTDINLWKNPQDRLKVTGILREKGYCENFEASFLHKNGKEIIGLMSAKIINIHGIQNIISITRDISDRKKADEAIETHHTILKALINSANDIIIFSLNSNYCYTSFNEAHFNEMKRVWNVEISLGMNLLDCMNITELQQAAKQSIDRALAGENFSEVQHQPELDLYYEFSWNPIKQNQRIIGATVFIRNITEQRRLFEIVSESEEKFKYIFDNSVIGKSITMLTGEINVNKAFCQMLGYTAEELDKKKWQEISHLDDIQLTQVEMNALISGEKKTTRFLKRYIHKNGSVVWTDVSSSLRLDANGKPLYFMTSTNDVTELKHAEMALDQSIERYKNLTAISPVGIFHTDENGDTTYVNQKYCQISGLTYLQALGLGWLSAIHADDKQYIIGNWDEIMKKQKPSFCDYRFVRPDGSITWVMGQAIPEMNIENKFVGYIGTITDITERKQAEDALKEKLWELERFNNLMIDREFRMIELKKEINELLIKFGEDKKYRIVGHEDCTASL